MSETSSERPFGQPALANQARSGLDPSGFDQAQWVGDRYSPNLLRWLKKNRPRFGGAVAFRALDGRIFIGWKFADDDGWFSGSALNTILTRGALAEVFAHPDGGNFTEVNGFWSAYDRIGRCAIDSAHVRMFIGSETRWREVGDVRECLWCGEHKQRRERYSVTEERERWVPEIGKE